MKSIARHVMWLALVAAAPGCDDEEDTVTGDQTHTETALVSDLPGQAKVSDPNLVNPWGMAFGPDTFFWVANAGTGTSTLYDREGTPQPAGDPLVVNVGSAEPTGVVFNDTGAFQVGEGELSAPASFIWVSLEGTISGWNVAVSGDTAQVLHEVPGAVYTGAAIATTPLQEPTLYVANFGSGSIDAFDGDFAQRDLGEDAFVDPDLPEGFAPFNVRSVDGDEIWVAYARSEGGEEVPGAGEGYVNVFATDGRFIRRFTSQGELDAPWGMTQAPDSFGDFADAMLIGNFGDGRIHAFNKDSGNPLGTLMNENGEEIVIEGLWAIEFGNGSNAGEQEIMYFTAGIDDETHGLFGAINMATPGGSNENPPDDNSDGAGGPYGDL